MSAEEKKEEGAGAEAPKKKSKKLLFIIIGVVVLLLGGGGAVFAMKGKAVDEHAEPKEIEPVLKLAKLDPFVVNLSDQASFVKVTMLLEYDQNILDREAGGHGSGGGHGYGGGASGGGEAAADAMPHALKEREPMIRDAILKVLSSKKAPEVLSTEGKEKLKEELISAVNEASGMEDGPIVNIYFVEFIVQ